MFNFSLLISLKMNWFSLFSRSSIQSSEFKYFFDLILILLMLLSSWIISDKILLLIWNCLSSIWVCSCSCWQTETQLIYWVMMLLNQVWSSIRKVYHASRALLTWVWNWVTVMSSLIKTRDVDDRVLLIFSNWLMM